MSSSDLVIDDEYISALGSFYINMGDNIVDEMINSYIKKMQEIKDKAIMEGEIAESLEAFIEYAQNLKDVAGEIGTELKDLMEYFITDIDKADEFLF